MAGRHEIGGQVGGRGNSWSGLYLRKTSNFILGGDITWGCSCAMSWIDLDLPFDLFCCDPDL